MLDNGNIFQKDSIYTALGLGAPVVQQSFNFGEFMKQVLLKEIQVTAPLSNIIRRRIGILLSQWIVVNVPAEDKQLAYQMYSFLLNPADKLNDSVVRITAGRSLRPVVDEWDFEPARFNPFAGPILENLIQLIEECEYDTQASILHTVSIIVERLDVAIVPFADRVMSLLWSLAEKYPDQLMTKQSIISMLGQIVKSTKAQSVKYHQHCFPIVANTLSPDSPDGAILCEDVLELWSILVLNTPSPIPPESAPLLDLIRFFAPIIQRGDDTLGTVSDIVDAYIMLVPDVMISKDVRIPLLSAIATLLGGKKNIWQIRDDSHESLRPVVQGQLLHILDLLAIEVDRREGPAGMASLISDFAETGVVNAMMSTLRGSYVARMYVSTVSGAAVYDEIKTSEGGGRWVWDTIDSLVVVDTFAVLSRLGLSNPTGLFDAISGWGRFVSSNPGETAYSSSSSASAEKEVKSVLPFDNVAWVLHEWFNTVENEAGLEQRKVMCLALTKMIQTPQWQIIDLMTDFMAMWTDVILQTADAGSLDFTNRNELEPIAEVESPGTVRAREHHQADPVKGVNVPETVRDCLTWLVGAMGGQDAFADKMRPVVGQEVMAGLERALAVNPE